MVEVLKLCPSDKIEQGEQGASRQMTFRGYLTSSIDELDDG